MTWFAINDQDEQTLSVFMRRVGTLPAQAGARERVATASQIWWKGQLLRRWDAERRVTAPIDFMQPIELAAGIACALFLLYRASPYFF